MIRNDPFTDTVKCIDRLYSEYQKHKSLIIACDFDSTVYDWTKEGFEFPRAFHVLKKSQELGFYIVLYTASDPTRWGLMKQYMQEKGIHISSINENPIPLKYGHHGKIYYNILIDDRAGAGQAMDILEAVINRVKKDKE